MHGSFNRAGFSLLEMIVVIALIGAVATIAISGYRSLSPGVERKKFLAQLDRLTGFAWQNARTTGKIHALLFDLKSHQVSVEIDSGKKDLNGKPIMQPVKRTYLSTSIPIPKNIQIKQFIIEGFDEASKGVLETAYFYLMPDGLTQHVTINMVDNKDKVFRGTSRQIGLVLNPFTAQFKEYDRFQK